LPGHSVRREAANPEGKALVAVPSIPIYGGLGVFGDTMEPMRALIVAKNDEHVALRLLSAVVLGWDAIPMATQGRLIRDAALMHNRDPEATFMPAKILAFIATHRDCLGTVLPR
jgi:hypothetical protein